MPDIGVACAGLVALMAAKAFGADAVAIADIKRDNLDLAMKLGADVALNPDKDAPPQAGPFFRVSWACWMHWWTG